MTTPTQTQQPQALSDLAFYLAVKHQQAQQEIASKTAAGLALLWGLLQYDKLDETTPAWLHAVTLQVEPQFRASEEAAFQFVQGTKWAIEPLSDPLKKVETVFPVREFQLAMRATGPATIKRGTQAAFQPPQSDSEALFRGVPPEVQQQNLERLANDLMAWGKLNSTGAAVSQTMNGGRGEVQQLVVIDARKRFKNRQVTGWARFTEDSENGPCYFCAVLASKGAFYLTSKAFDRSNAKFVGEGTAKVHDHCKCTLRPVYRAEDKMDDRAKNFLSQWNESGKGMNLGYKEQLKQFRRDYKMPARYDENPAVNLEDVRRNRELVARELGERSPHVKWWDRQLKQLEAI